MSLDSFSMNDDLPPAVERRLNGLLSRWAATHRLRDRQAGAIRQAIRSLPAAPDFDWWWNLLDPVNGTVFRGSPSQPAFPTPPALPVETWTAAFVHPDAWYQHETADYQPYLRLA